MEQGDLQQGIVKRMKLRRSKSFKAETLKWKRPKFRFRRSLISSGSKEQKKLSTTFNPADEDPNDLLTLAFAMFDICGCIKDCKINPKLLREFITTAACAYRPNPYHNWSHAFYVMFFAYRLLSRARIHFNRADIIGLLISALCHDLEHPGTANNVLVELNTNRAQRYHNISVNENHSIDCADRILEKHNILSNLPEHEQGYIKELIRDLILSTDIESTQRKAWVNSKWSDFSTKYEKYRVDHPENDVSNQRNRTKSLPASLIDPPKKIHHDYELDLTDDFELDLTENMRRIELDPELVTIDENEETKELPFFDGVDVPKQKLAKDMRVSVLRMIILCSDIGCVADPFDLSFSWAKKLFQELLLIGRKVLTLQAEHRERGRSMSLVAPSPISVDQFTGGQVKFFDAYATRLFDQVHDSGVFFDFGVFTARVHGNAQRWARLNLSEVHKLLENDNNLAREDWAHSFMSGNHTFDRLTIVDEPPALGSVAEETRQGRHATKKHAKKGAKKGNKLFARIPVAPIQAPEQSTSAPGSLEKSIVSKRFKLKRKKKARFAEPTSPGEEREKIEKQSRRRKLFENMRAVKFRTLPRDFVLNRFRSHTIDAPSVSLPCSPRNESPISSPSMHGSPPSPFGSPSLTPVPTYLGSPQIMHRNLPDSHTLSPPGGPLPEMPDLDEEDDQFEPPPPNQPLDEMPDIDDDFDEYADLLPPNDMPVLDLDPPGSADNSRPGSAENSRKD